MYITQEMIEEVKDKVSIPDYMSKIVVTELRDYYSDYDGTFAYTNVTKCPVHVEDTPSFRFYPETNSCSCFGCRFGGDVINLHRKFMSVNKNTEVNFYEAVEFLRTVFINNEEYIRKVKTREGTYELRYSTVAEEKRKSSVIRVESNNVELARYAMTLRRAEEKLLKNSAIEEEEKAKVYNFMDTIQMMVEHKKINAETARKLIVEKIGQ